MVASLKLQCWVRDPIQMFTPGSGLSRWEIFAQLGPGVRNVLCEGLLHNLVILTYLESLFNFRMRTKRDLVSKSPSVLFVLKHKIPLGHSNEMFHFRRNTPLRSTWNNSFFPIQKNQRTKQWVIPSPLCVPHPLNQMVLL